MQNSELKKKSEVLRNCPFCGGEAEFHRTNIKTNGGWTDSVVVRCKVCEARTNRVIYNAKKHQNDAEYDEVAKAWNTRKQMDDMVDVLINLPYIKEIIGE